MALTPWPAGTPAPALPKRPPSLLVAIALQLLLFREPLRRFHRRAKLGAARRGDSEPVLVIPGMGVGDFSTAPLRRYLRRQGFDARGWGLGRNRPEVTRRLLRLLERLEAFAVEACQPVALIGWSLGGILARELARLRPDLVAGVITLGTPVVGGLAHTAIAGLFRIQGWDIAGIATLVETANRTPLRVPVTAIWSRRDGIVAWQACVDTESPEAENLEATSVHWALGFDPDVFLAIAERLAS